jgi:hypothetical protein
MKGGGGQCHFSASFDALFFLSSSPPYDTILGEFLHISSFEESRWSVRQLISWILGTAALSNPSVHKINSRQNGKWVWSQQAVHVTSFIQKIFHIPNEKLIQIMQISKIKETLPNNTRYHLLTVLYVIYFMSPTFLTWALINSSTAQPPTPLLFHFFLCRQNCFR